MSDAEHASSLFVAGFNAFSQLSAIKTGDIRDFGPILTGQGYASIRVLFTCWSSTVLLVGDQLIALGFQSFQQRLNEDIAHSLTDAFGDHDGMIGCLDRQGRLYLLSRDNGIRNGALVRRSVASSPTLSHVAMATNGRVAVVLRDGMTKQPAFEIVEFKTLSDFLAWFGDPRSATLETKPRRFFIIDRPVKLLANVATFLLLTHTGQVYSWGDPRHQSLGRAVFGVDGSPADKPVALEALGGLRISKIACGGWICAALSDDRALYLWGTNTPGTDDLLIKPLQEAEAGEVVLVDVTGADGEPVDIIDVGIGNSHVVFLGADGDCWGVGANRNGQLGSLTENRFIEDWTPLTTPSNIRSVVCGPKCTLMLSNRPSPGP